MVPLIGGITGFIAVRILVGLRAGPDAGVTWHAFLPPALDPGCYLVYLLVMPLARKLRGRD